jgi:hypothetical protein
MSMPYLCFDDPNRPDRVVAVDPDPQSVVRPGDRPNTATVIAPDGTETQVQGEPADVHLQIQAAAARAHGTGEVEIANTPVN